MTLTSTLTHKFCSSRRPILETNQPGKINMEPENHPSARGKSSWTKPSWCVSSRSFSTVKLKLFFSFSRWWTSAISFMMNVAGVWIAATSVLVNSRKSWLDAEEMYLKGAKNCFNEWYFEYTLRGSRMQSSPHRIVTSFFGNRESQDIPSY